MRSTVIVDAKREQSYVNEHQLLVTEVYAAERVFLLLNIISSSL